MTVPDARIRTLIAARRTFLVWEQYDNTKGCLGQLGQPSESSAPNAPDTPAPWKLLQSDRSRLQWSCVPLNRARRKEIDSLDPFSGYPACVFHNASTPFLLRTARESPCRNVIFERWYVGGITYGEAFKKIRLNAELSQSDEGATCTSTGKRSIPLSKKFTHPGSGEHIFWCT